MSQPSVFKIHLLNQISAAGLARLPIEHYQCSKQIDQPDALLVRSADLHHTDIPASVKAIGRAGAGTNNIPVSRMSERGIPVFNAPGANANAVKELVLTAMLLSARNITGALRFVQQLDPALPDMDKVVEEGKKNFVGGELAGKTLGVIGLGKIGCLIADAAIKLGMRVYGYDPDITVDAAWSLPSQVRKAHTIPELLRVADFVTLHVPLLDATRHLINDTSVQQMKAGATLLNFSRDAVVSESAILHALHSQHLHYYVCDFPSPALNAHPQVIALPHLGASTLEAEENCAIMVADQLRDYLEHGNVQYSVNFPTVTMPRESAYRIGIANANVPNMVGQISTAMAQAGLNIHNMINKSRGEMAYTLLDIDSPAPAAVLNTLRSIPGVLAVRDLPLPT